MINAAVIVELEIPGDFELGPNWSVGPAPLAAEASGRDPNGEVEREMRCTYFEPVVHDVLYGTADRAARWWTRYDPPAEVVADAEIRYQELLVNRDPVVGSVIALLVVHLRVTGDPLAALPRLTRVAADAPSQSGMASAYASLVGSGAKPRPTARRAYPVIYAEPAGDLPAILAADATPRAYADPHEQWMFYLAATTSPEDYPLPRRDASRSNAIVLSDDWDAVILRDGAAFLARGPRANSHHFLATAEMLVATVYLDALLMGHLQRIKVRELAGDVSALGDPTAHAHELSGLERRLLWFTNTLWWGHVTSHAIANRVLARYRQQHRLEELSQQLRDTVPVYSGHVQAQAATRSEALLGLLAIVGLPFAILLEAVQAVVADSLWGWLSIGGGVLAIVLMILFVPGVQDLLRPVLRARLGSLQLPRR